MDSSAHQALWERHQSELWERIFQLAQDIAGLAEKVTPTSGGSVVRQELVRSSMSIGKYVVRATASPKERTFLSMLEEARLQAIEADYWLRLAYVLEQKESFQRDISSTIAQLGSVIELLKKMASHIQRQHDGGRHVSRNKISL